ncbi:MAG: DPP IV N-terminal domain-containing protein [Acidobacteria bacterium]|nr:DPP IV N-terminal domain-containing protein [Acidobacteriota bacterium]
MQISPDGTGQEKRHGTRLDSWKEIAAYLNRDIRTVQRWEKTAKLPVKRLQTPGLRAVFAYTEELDQWLKLQNPESPVAPPRNYRWLALGGVAALVTVLGFVWVSRPKPSIPLNPRPITSEPFIERDPSFSPDGMNVTYSAPTQNSPFNIFVRPINGGSPVQLTDHPQENRSPAWSPDGSRIAFLRGNLAQKASLMLIPALGGEETKLVEIAPHPARRFLNIGRLLAWSPDGKHIAFPDRGESLSAPIYLFDVESRERKQLSFPSPTEHDIEPSFSPDGRTLLFTRAINELTSTVMMQPLNASMQPDGPPRKIAGVGPWNASPVWLPSTKDILFCSGAFPRLFLYRVPSDGSSAPLPYAITGDHSMQLAYHAGSGRLISRNNRIQNDIIRFSLENPKQAKVIIQSSFVDRSPAYSPDGSQIAFISDRTGKRQIWVSDANGANPIAWTRDMEVDGLRPDWSPDGKKLLFVASAPGMSQVFSVDSDTRKSTRLSNDSLEYVNARYSRDGKTIYAWVKENGSNVIYSMPSEGGKARPMGLKGGAILGESPDGQSLYFFGSKPDRSRWLKRASLDGKTVDWVANVPLVENSALTRQGIMYYEVKSGEATIFLIPFSGTPKQIQKYEIEDARGLSVSPDSKFILCTRVQPQIADLYLVENVR